MALLPVYKRVIQFPFSDQLEGLFFSVFLSFKFIVSYCFVSPSVLSVCSDRIILILLPLIIIIIFPSPNFILLYYIRYLVLLTHTSRLWLQTQLSIIDLPLTFPPRLRTPLEDPTNNW